ncbi:MAG: FKBP-type peptidyl-prolyl cis-trans isomerase [Prolixibacteraceae bacterium]
MNLKSVIIVLAASVVLAACQKNNSSKTVELTNENDSASYALGVLIGQNNKQNLDASPGTKDLNVDILMNAFEKQMKGEESQMDATQANTLIQGFFEKVSAKEATKNAEEGEAFLEQNKTKEGVTTTASGLQYEILKEGTGPKPTAQQNVKCHYHGTLIDGKVFDSSVDRGEPATFNVSGVIPGWTEALQLMPVGSKWKLYIPGELAYGERGAGRDIGPNTMLIFEVELLEIVE